MAGHSKWKNRAHRKGKQDASRGQLFTKLCRDVFVAAKRGGGNPDVNYHLKVALDKARGASVPAETLARTVTKATGNLDGQQFEDLIYEGYGPGGFAILLELSTNNRNRTAAEIRHLFSKYGGSLGESGCVMWLFKRVGVLEVETAEAALSEDEFTLLALEAGVEDLDVEEDSYQLYTRVEDLTAVEEALRTRGVQTSGARVGYVAETAAEVTREDEERAEQLLSLLEEYEDIQNVYTNAVFAGDSEE